MVIILISKGILQNSSSHQIQTITTILAINKGSKRLRNFRKLFNLFF